MKKYAIIVAGGSGSRMQTETPKQFLQLSNKPILIHTIERFLEYDAEINIILVLPKSHHDTWNSICDDFKYQNTITLAEGGAQRFYSVKNGLEKIDGNGVVAVHDGVRPLVSLEVITNTFEAAEKNGAAIPYLPLKESLRKLSDQGKSIFVKRSEYITIQTPQCFEVNTLKDAYQQEYHDGFTDDASVYESFGKQVHLVLGNPENIKITVPVDLIFAEAILSK